MNPMESILLNANISYLVIDAQYLNDIRDKKDMLGDPNWPERIKKEIFPYALNPFAFLEVKDATTPTVTINDINILAVSIDEADVRDKDQCTFCSDTGLIVFINQSYLKSFLLVFDYNTLTGSETDLIDKEYWNDIISKFKQNDVGLISTASGSGFYKVIIT